MSDRSSIEWTDSTWNPVTGCDRVSEGCDHCYALTLAARLKAMGNPRYQRDGDRRRSGPGFGVTLHPDKLTEPLRWRTPRMVFVNSMSDLFHDDVPEGFIARVFAVMEQAGRHTFQVLTKRPARMARLMNSAEFMQRARLIAALAPANGDKRRTERWPPPNVWLGTSVENQRWADIRVPHLLRTPAEVRFLSCEPLLGPVDLTAWLETDREAAGEPSGRVEWIIVGGESGRNARPMHLDWARSLRDQCVPTGVPFFFKQWGGRTPKAGGRELDGRTWDEMPTRFSAAALAG